MGNGLRWTEEQLRDYERRRAATGKPALAEPAPGGVVPAPQSQRCPAVEPVAKVEREAVVQKRRLVRITSFRVALVDDDNCYCKDLLDALTESGAIVDDSKEWIRLEREQVKVEHKWQERTEVEVRDL